LIGFSNDVFVLNTVGDYATNSEKIKYYITLLINPLSKVRINFGFGFYNGKTAQLTLPLTIISNASFYLYVRALEADLKDLNAFYDDGLQNALFLLSFKDKDRKRKEDKNTKIKGDARTLG
jgi:hypothetical protein